MLSATLPRMQGKPSSSGSKGGFFASFFFLAFPRHLELLALS